LIKEDELKILVGEKTAGVSKIERHGYIDIRNQLRQAETLPQNAVDREGFARNVERTSKSLLTLHSAHTGKRSTARCCSILHKQLRDEGRDKLESIHPALSLGKEGKD